MSAIANQRAFPYIFLADLKKNIFHIVILVKYVYFLPCLQVWAILRGLSVTFGGLYTSLHIHLYVCRWRWPLYEFFFFVISLLYEWKSNRPHPPACHFLACKKSWCVWQMEAFSDLKKMCNWIALWIEGLYMNFLCITNIVGSFETELLIKLTHTH